MLFGYMDPWGIYSLDSYSDFHVVDFDEPLNQEGFGVKELGILV